ncbi:MAG: hypothetical protein HQK52_17140 [Oligoflexia bacterium]|nr:hypothetical protein [Oligoflexia bacterium]
MKNFVMIMFFVLITLPQLASSNESKGQKEDQVSKEQEPEWLVFIRKKRIEMEEQRKAEGKPPLDWNERVKHFDARIEKSVKDAQKKSDKMMAYLSQPTEYDIKFKKIMEAKQREVEQEFIANVRHINKASADFQERFAAKQAQMSKEQSEFDKQFFKEMMTETKDFKKRHDEFEKQFDNSVKKIVDCGYDYKNPVLKAWVDLVCSH